jgi:hypothetical protein
MSRTWVLDTETKGTGAHIAPLRHGAPARERELSLAHFTAPAPAPAEPFESAPAPRRFRVVDVLAGVTIADDVQVADALLALRRLRKAIDARVYVWEEQPGRWRLLGLGETRMLWDMRELDRPAGDARQD